MIMLIGHVLRIHTVLGGVGGCCLPGVRYLTKEKVTAKDKRQWHVPGSVTGTFSESEKSSRSIFSRYQKKKNVCWSSTCPLSPVPSSLVRGFQKRGHPRPLVQVLLHVWGSTPHVLEAPQAKQKGSQAGLQSSPWLSGHLPPALAFPIPLTPAPIHATACVPCPHGPQGRPFPRAPLIQVFPLPGFPAAAACPSLPHLDPNTIPETQTRKVTTLYPRN